MKIPDKTEGDIFFYIRGGICKILHKNIGCEIRPIFFYQTENDFSKIRRRT